MKNPPLGEMPWEAQLFFWILMLLVTIGFGVAIWFLHRYIKNQDDINESNKRALRNLSDEFEDTKKAVSSANLVLLKELQETKSAAIETRSKTIEDIHQLRQDFTEVKNLSKAVEAHHTILKSIVVKLQNLQILKTPQKKD